MSGEEKAKKLQEKKYSKGRIEELLSITCEEEERIMQKNSDDKRNLESRQSAQRWR
jgi:dephospho-CoA kinase